MSRKLRSCVVLLTVGLAWIAPTPASAAPGSASVAAVAAAGTARPLGAVDSGTQVDQTFTMTGWAFDPDAATRSIAVDVYDQRPDGSVAGVRVTANTSRPDIDRVFGVGAAHGFSATVTLPVAGVHTVCAFAIDTESAALNTLIGCRTAAVGGPVGSLDTVRMIVPQRLSVEGWAAQPGAPDADTELNVYVTAPDGTVSGYGGIMTETVRTDVKSVFGWTNGRTGFGTEIPINQTGVHQVCVFAIGTAQGVSGPIPRTNTLLGCPTVTVQNTFGSLDDVSWAAGSLRVRGWALNPNATTVPTEVHVYDFGPTATVARSGLFTSTARPDVVAAFPGLGSQPGFDFSLPSSGAGRHTVCAYGITAGGGTGNVSLGCRDVTVG